MYSIFLYHMQQGWILYFRCPRQTLRKGPYIFCICYTKNDSLKASLILILSGNLILHEGPFRIVNCLKSIDFKLFFVYTLNLLKVPFWHIYT